MSIRARWLKCQSFIKSMMPRRKSSMTQSKAQRVTLWDGALLSTKNDSGKLVNIARWDRVHRKATWFDRSMKTANRLHVVLDESLSFAGMTEEPKGKTAEERGESLRLSLSNECPIPMEDALTAALYGEGNKKAENHVLFVASRTGIDELAIATRELGMRVRKVEPFASALARGVWAYSKDKLDQHKKKVGFWVPGLQRSYLLVFQEEKLQWLMEQKVGVTDWHAMSTALQEVLEYFNTRESYEALEHLVIFHASEQNEDWNASLIEHQLLSDPQRFGQLSVVKVPVESPLERVPQWIVLSGGDYVAY